MGANMKLDEGKAVLAKYYRKVIFWYRAAHFGLILIILFGILSFLIRLSTDNYALPVILASVMIPATIFVCFSLYRMRFWGDKAERQSLDLALMDFQH